MQVNGETGNLTEL